MSIKGLTVSGGMVYQEIDLSEVFGVSFDGQEALKLAISQEIVDFMRARTKAGVDYNGKDFAKYSESYKKSDEFEAYGKTSKVDMQLKGDMLASIDFETMGSTSKFFFDDPDDEAKAFGHMSGMEGHKHLDGKTPKRLFFGITEKDLVERIGPKFSGEIEMLKAQRSDAEPFMSLEQALGLVGTAPNSKTLEELLSDLWG